MSLHNWTDETMPHLLPSPLEEITTAQPSSRPLDPDLQTLPWLDEGFLNRLDQLNDVSQPQLDRSTMSSADTDAMVSESIAAFSHEVRTPLSTIHATLELLSDGVPIDTDDLPQLVDRLHRGVSWITELVENLSSSPTAPTDIVSREHDITCVRSWIEEAVELVKPLAEHRNQTILFVCPQPAPVVFGDGFRLGQVIVNLLTNACRYGAWADTIAVSVSTANGCVTVRVSDHGMGIRPEERDRIFERMVRGTQTGGALVDGQGLGLHISREIVEEHGGTIGVESVVGQGSTFTVRLPAIQERSPLVLRHSARKESDVSE